MIARLLFAGVLLLTFFSSPEPRAIPNPNNLGNGWYPNLPPVTADKLAGKIDCLVAFGAPAQPSLIATPVLNIHGGLGFAPSQLVWAKEGREIQTDAVLTYYGPAVAYVEIAKTFSLPVKLISCPDVPAAVLVELKSPIGDAWPDRCGKCFRPSPDDKFEIGARFQDGSGGFVKRRGWYAFVPYGYWEHD
ncbi:MAG: hypothetical protein ACRDGM_05860 [bacterium]